MTQPHQIARNPWDVAVLTKAALRAADRRGLSGRQLANIVGVSEATVSRWKRGANLAVLTSPAFATPQPVERQTWPNRIGPACAQALRKHPRFVLEFPTEFFAPDPRLVGMIWNLPRARGQDCRQRMATGRHGPGPL